MMDLNLSGKQPTFRRSANQKKPYGIYFLLALLIPALFLLRAVLREDIRSPFLPTPVPTRTANSYALEGDTHFMAGNLNEAIRAYQQATVADPNNASLYVELARIQTYSSATLTTDQQKRIRMEEALASAARAIELSPEESLPHAVRSFTLNWYANPALVGDQRDKYLTEAEQEAVRALQIDPQNGLVLAYYAEIMVDQYNLLRADQFIRQALERSPELMDVHRVHALVLESMGNYGEAIRAYERAIAIQPNLTFLYLSLGVNYRHLKRYDEALENFAQAVAINNRLGIKDPLPYVAIGKTYSQIGEFFAASRNVLRALRVDPLNQDTYGVLGVVYFKSRNYEGAILALKCAVRGCSAEESCEVRQCDPQNDPLVEIEALPLSSSTVLYYYTYGSVLAGMHRPHDDYCIQALGVLSEVRSGFATDADIISIVQASESICAATPASQSP
ncbi:MAG: tetratricopeptide repeat protein [Anaerolineaceae bacterium]|nr:tetratricopeptide repeat protein [Anaerolineaceae bacterium]